MNNKRAKSKQLIQLAFYQLLLRKDFDDISIKEICEKAGVSRMSFYRYYSTKEDVFIVFCDETFDAFFQQISHKPSLTLKDMYILFFTNLKKYHREIDMLKKSQRETILLAQFEQYASYMASKKYFSIATNPNPFSIPFYSGGLFNVVMRWSNRNYQDTPEEMTEAMLKFVSINN
ncbi:MAG: TetR/AcrR family transcriptional regulator [Bacilli bacterium]|nr:TetR/AcrR family transcriptional regulator [Bacilli bacterium]